MVSVTPLSNTPNILLNRGLILQDFNESKLLLINLAFPFHMMDILEMPQKAEEEYFKNQLALHLPIRQYQLPKTNHSKSTRGPSRSGMLLGTVPVISPGLLLTPPKLAEIEENSLVPMGFLFALRLLILD